MNTPIVSVLMSVYNAREDELRQSIESILTQTFKEFEFIIINDGSTNNNEQVILSYNDKRIRYIKNETNLKIIKSLNRGLEFCSGKYIARLDADDYSAPKRLEKQVKYMEKHTNVGGLGTFFKKLDTGQIVKPPFKQNDVKLLTRYVVGCISNPSGMIRKSVLTDNNLKYDENCLHAEDFKLWADMSYYSDLAVIPEVLTFIRSHEDGVSKTNAAWQDKIVRVVLLDNIIRDFASDTKYFYSILNKYVRNQVISNEELQNFKGLIEHVILKVAFQISLPYNIIVEPSLMHMLNKLAISGRI